MKPVFNTHSLIMLGIFALAYSIFAANTASAENSTDYYNLERDEGRYSFALWGDLPYAKNGDDPKIAKLIDSMNAENLEFTVFDGDTKDGSSVCMDEVIVTRNINCRRF